MFCGIFAVPHFSARWYGFNDFNGRDGVRAALVCLVFGANVSAIRCVCLSIKAPVRKEIRWLRASARSPTSRFVREPWYLHLYPSVHRDIRFAYCSCLRRLSVCRVHTECMRTSTFSGRGCRRTTAMFSARSSRIPCRIVDFSRPPVTSNFIDLWVKSKRTTETVLLWLSRHSNFVNASPLSLTVENVCFLYGLLA